MKESQRNLVKYSEVADIADDGETKAIEVDFPIAEISKVAKRESWRKEVYRPPHYIHKWWARRLGSVFRAIIIGCCADESEDIMDTFYEKARFDDKVVFDPMMGSGVTVGEAYKLGCSSIGRDINPIAYDLVKTALNHYSRSEVMETYEQIESAVSDEVKQYYKTKDGDDVLYYFWVKQIPCPQCEAKVPLFKSRIFSKNAYPSKYPEARALCPNCEAINTIEYDDEEAVCSECDTSYNPQDGPARRSRADCPECENDFKILDAVRELDTPPEERMYAKIVLNDDGEKEYRRITDFDRDLFKEASDELGHKEIELPDTEIEPGYNTDQIRNYNYESWDQLFNERQLLTLTKIADTIKEIEEERMRELFTTFFTGVLEFNSMLCSFKGEGTGAVRHTFSHHILKPEKTPLEANPWGTSKSSGAFSQLFQTRLLRALDYKGDPFELRLDEDGESQKVHGINRSMNAKVMGSYEDFETGTDSVYLSCGDSSETDIESESVDIVVTDPPFFDNVHYSQLADFFYVWQKKILNGSLGNEAFKGDSTRRPGEVQDEDSEDFSDKLADVYSECNRVLKQDGYLAFTYHHSSPEGWHSMLRSLRKAGFIVQAAYPVKSEMSVAVPKSQADEPINIDTILVCRKDELTEFQEDVSTDILEAHKQRTKEFTTRFQEADIEVSKTDVRVTLMANLLTDLSQVKDTQKSLRFLQEKEGEIKEIAAEIHSSLY